jgi:hypothetical protein
VFLDGVGGLGRARLGSARHAWDVTESGPSRQEKREVMQRGASWRDGRAATTRR